MATSGGKWEIPEPLKGAIPDHLGSKARLPWAPDGTHGSCVQLPRDGHCAVTTFDLADGWLVPATFTATTVKEYWPAASVIE
jgi:hypothetical protein